MKKPQLGFAALPAIEAVENAARGGSLPVHYPRTASQPAPTGESFKWFVENEKQDRNREERYSLPPLSEPDRGLPELEET